MDLENDYRLRKRWWTSGVHGAHVFAVHIVDIHVHKYLMGTCMPGEPGVGPGRLHRPSPCGALVHTE